MEAEGESLGAQDVQTLARQGRVAPDPAYHAYEKGFRFDRIVNLLCLCSRVARDHRPGHAAAHVAWAQNWAGEKFRIDFNLKNDQEGQRMILVVTAMQLEAEK